MSAHGVCSLNDYRYVELVDLWACQAVSRLEESNRGAISPGNIGDASHHALMCILPFRCEIDITLVFARIGICEKTDEKRPREPRRRRAQDMQGENRFTLALGSASGQDTR